MLRAKTCPNCGGPIDFSTYRCKYCNTQFYREGEEDLVEYDYDNNFHPELVDGDYATIATQVKLQEDDIKLFEQDVEFRNRVARDLAANLADELVKRMHFNISDSVHGCGKYIRGYLKVKRYSAPLEGEICKKFL